MSGNCATGMRNIASAPAMVITIAMTIASRGRSTKTEEIMDQWPAEVPAEPPLPEPPPAGEPLAGVGLAGLVAAAVAGPALPLLACGRGRRAWRRGVHPGPRGGGSGRDLHAGTHPLDAVHDHHLALGEPGHHDGCVGRRLAELDAALLRLVLAIHDIDVVALLVG